MCLGIPGQIIRIEDPADLVATVDVCGVRRRINIACIVDDDHPAQDCIGDWVLVHVGFAMSRIDEVQAQETLRLLEELAQMQEEMLGFSGGLEGAVPP
jgi:hydrogenase expression/formation protein HypC